MKVSNAVSTSAHLNELLELLRTLMEYRSSDVRQRLEKVGRAASMLHMDVLLLIYHLARFSDAAVLALELGHTNSNLVFTHYRQIVKPKKAERYWKITPAPTGRKLVAFAAQSV